MANSEDPDEMPHNAAFHSGLFCLLRQNRFSEKEIQYDWENITFTVVPTKSDSNIVFCLQLLSKTSTCTHHVS